MTLRSASPLTGKARRAVPEIDRLPPLFGAKVVSQIVELYLFIALYEYNKLRVLVPEAHRHARRLWLEFTIA